MYDIDIDTDKDDALKFLSGLGAGLAVMYLADPARGRRRRHLIRDQMVHAGHRVSDGLGATSRDLKNRGAGFVAEAGSHLTSDAAEDRVIEARARSALGRVCSHPRAVHVEVVDGSVHLSGQILQAELDDVLGAVEGTRGVESVDHDLEVFGDPGNVPSLQGGRSRYGPRFELLQWNWTPAARLLTSLIGGAAVLYGAWRRDSIGTAISVAGAGVLTRAVTNMEPGLLALPPERERSAHGGARKTEARARSRARTDAPVQFADMRPIDSEARPSTATVTGDLDTTPPGVVP